LRVFPLVRVQGMPHGPFSHIASLRSVFVVSALLLAVACSKEDRRDQNYGTDSGVGYHLPDGGALLDAALPADAPTGDTSDAGGATDGQGQEPDDGGEGDTNRPEVVDGPGG
jgi:hypothetical protein